jgi:hypothetical protein
MLLAPPPNPQAGGSPVVGCPRLLAQYSRSWATGWTTGIVGFDSRRGLGIFLFTITSRKALGPTQPPILWVPAALSVMIKRPGREAEHSPSSSAEVRWVDQYLHSPITPSWRGAQLKRRTGTTLLYFPGWRWVVSFASWSLYHRGKDPGTHCIGSWVDFRAGLDAVVKRKYPYPYETRTPVVHPVARRLSSSLKLDCEPLTAPTTILSCYIQKCVVRVKRNLMRLRSFSV